MQIKRNIKKNKSHVGELWLFILWPFYSFIIAIFKYREVNSKNILWFFSIYLGLTFVIHDAADASRYVDSLKLLYLNDKLDFNKFVEANLFIDNKFRIDFMDPLIQYIISRFTDSGRMLLGFYGVILGYFYSRNAAFILDRFKTKLKTESLMFLILFVALVPFWEINGFRFWTATHVFIYGLINYISFRNKTKGLLLIISSVFFHDTFMFSIGIFLLYAILINYKNCIHFVFIFYCISVFISNIDFDYFRNLIETNGLIRSSRAGYVDENYALENSLKSATTNFYVRYEYTLMKVLILGSTIWIYFFRSKLLRGHKEILHYFVIGLLFMSTTNILSEIPSMARFYYIGFMCISIMLYLFFGEVNFKRRPDWYKILSIFVVSITVFAKVWSGLLYFSLGSVLSNPLFFWLFDTDLSINEIIKGFF